MELYRPVRSKKKKTPKRMSGSSTKIEQENETTNIKPKRVNSNPPNHSTFSTENQEVQIQLYFNQNKQPSSNVQHQKKIRSTKIIYNNEKNGI
jgi:hypothetical protein